MSANSDAHSITVFKSAPARLMTDRGTSDDRATTIAFRMADQSRLGSVIPGLDVDRRTIRVCIELQNQVSLDGGVASKLCDHDSPHGFSRGWILRRQVCATCHRTDGHRLRRYPLDP